MSAYIVKGLLPLTDQRGGAPTSRREIVGEIKRTLGAYLERVLDPAGHAS